MASRISISVPTLAAIAIALALITGMTALIRASAQSPEPAARQPMPVAVTEFRVEDAYRRDSLHLGTVQAASDSAVGFEVSGQLAEMPVSEGYRVSKGDVLARLDTSRRQAQLANAQGQLARVESELELAEKRAERAAALVAQNLASDETLDEARLGAEALRAARASAQAVVDDARLQIELSTLHAPYDAIIAERLLQPGASLAPGAPVLRLVAAAQREAHVGVPVTMARELNIGQTYPLRVADQRFEAILRGLGDDMDPATLTLNAVFNLPTTISASVGQPVTMSLQRVVPSRGGWLPLSALLEGQRGLWSILRVDDSGDGARTVRESVEVVYVRGESAFVRGTLPDGASVVATGLQRISPGARIVPTGADDALAPLRGSRG